MVDKLEKPVPSDGPFEIVIRKAIIDIINNVNQLNDELRLLSDKIHSHINDMKVIVKGDDVKNEKQIWHSVEESLPEMDRDVL